MCTWAVCRKSWPLLEFAPAAKPHVIGKASKVPHKAPTYLSAPRARSAAQGSASPLSVPVPGCVQARSGASVWGQRMHVVGVRAAVARCQGAWGGGLARPQTTLI